MKGHNNKRKIYTSQYDSQIGNADTNFLLHYVHTSTVTACQTPVQVFQDWNDCSLLTDSCRMVLKILRHYYSHSHNNATSWTKIYNLIMYVNRPILEYVC